MALPVRQQLKYWGIAAVVFFLVLWFLGNVILPFVLGAAIAYFLDPVADRLEAAGCSRGAATGIITFGAILVFVVGALLIVPTLVAQAAALAQSVPEIFQDLQMFVTEKVPELGDANSTIRQSLSAIGETLSTKGDQLLNTILSSFSGIVNFVVLFVIVPVVAFYLLYDWDNLVAKVDSLLPRDHAPVIRQLASDIDRTMASFIRGQGTVCLILGAFYAIALMMVGLSFGLVVGVVAGALTFIPYVGALVGGILAIGLALFQFWGDWIWIAAVVIIFALGQFFEGNILTPKLVGGSVGLHPVWLIFALSAFGTLFGFVGLLVAVPVAASIGVIVRFAISGYKESLLYKGVAGREEEP